MYSTIWGPIFIFHLRAPKSQVRHCNLPCPESLAPILDVPMLDPPTLESAHEGPSDASNSQRREVDNSHSPFCNKLD